MEAWCCRSWCSQLKPNFPRGWGTGERLRPARTATLPSRASLPREIPSPQAWKSKGTHYWVGIVRIWGVGWWIPCEILLEAWRSSRECQRAAERRKAELVVPSAGQNPSQRAGTHKINSNSPYCFHLIVLLSLKNSLKEYLKISMIEVL